MRPVQQLGDIVDAGLDLVRELARTTSRHFDRCDLSFLPWWLDGGILVAVFEFGELIHIVDIGSAFPDGEFFEGAQNSGGVVAHQSAQSDMGDQFLVAQIDQMWQLQPSSSACAFSVIRGCLCVCISQHSM